MHAYLFIAITTVSQIRPNRERYGPAETFQSWENSLAFVILEDHPDTAQKIFEDCLYHQPENEHPRQNQVHKISATQLVDNLITESGDTPPDWVEIRNQVFAPSQSDVVDDYEQGYWLDVNTAIPSMSLAPNVETLQQNLTEDIRAGLNWSADKQFYFLLSSMSHAPAVTDEPSDEAAGTDDDKATVARLLVTFPEAADRQATALIRARNSAVAAWLWRRYIADTPIASNPIRIDPWCPIIIPES